MVTVAIVGNGPIDLIPDLSVYKDEVNVWIGADKGALTIINQNLELDFAIGDFDSVTELELNVITKYAKHFHQYKVEKDETDLELAILKAIAFNPNTIYLFGVTGGRLDHTLINIQLLTTVTSKKIRGLIIDTSNQLELMSPGNYHIEKDDQYPTISFIPLTKEVQSLTLTGFYYPLSNATITRGSTLSISNKLNSNNGTFSFKSGIVLVVRSRG